MSRIIFEPVGEKITTSFPIADSNIDDFWCFQSQGIGWNIRPQSNDNVELSTGGDLKTIDGSVYVTVGEATPDGKAQFSDGQRWGGLSYHEAIPNADVFTPENYSVQLYVSRVVYARILTLVEQGSPPIIEVQLGPLDLKSPDSPGIKSMMHVAPWCEIKWDNAAYKYLPIKWCSFSSVITRRALIIDEPQEGDSALQPPTKQDVEAVRHSVAQLERFVPWLLYPAWGIAALLAVIVLRGH